jgi:hypothetical protein
MSRASEKIRMPHTLGYNSPLQGEDSVLVADNFPVQAAGWYAHVLSFAI